MSKELKAMLREELANYIMGRIMKIEVYDDTTVDEDEANLATIDILDTVMHHIDVYVKGSKA